MSTAYEYEPTTEDLLADAARIIEEHPGWEDIAADVIDAAEQRLDGVPLTPELEMWLRVAGRLAAGRFKVAASLALIDSLPDDPDLLDRDRAEDPPYRRRGVQHLAYVEDGP